MERGFFWCGICEFAKSRWRRQNNRSVSNRQCSTVTELGVGLIPSELVPWLAEYSMLTIVVGAYQSVRESLSGSQPQIPPMSTLLMSSPCLRWSYEGSNDAYQQYLCQNLWTVWCQRKNRLFSWRKLWPTSAQSLSYPINNRVRHTNAITWEPT